MEQDKIKLIHLYLGVFVIGIVLMAFSLEKQIENDKIFQSISIYLISLSLLSFCFSLYYKFEYFNDLILKQGIKNVKELFILTNIFWFLIVFTVFIDQFFNSSFNSFNEIDFVFIFLLFGCVIVNFTIGIFSFHVDFNVPFFYIKKNLNFSDFFAIIIIATMKALFGIIIYFLIIASFPATAICFTFLNFILINVLSAILKK
ncbi:hypothetical protein [Chishuiella sp.]|uniref:hypothetical protein n=1 Tax=Chishuiella sp. TaxID=1969467 RepID=UPI0028B1BD2C|nr:hypothetical protein [Chishuiella sp.]